TREPSKLQSGVRFPPPVPPIVRAAPRRVPAYLAGARRGEHIDRAAMLPGACAPQAAWPLYFVRLTYTSAETRIWRQITSVQIYTGRRCLGIPIDGALSHRNSAAACQAAQDTIAPPAPHTAWLSFSRGRFYVARRPLTDRIHHIRRSTALSTPASAA